MDKNTERDIARDLQQGDRLAWLQLYEAYAEPVWRNISRLTGCDSTTVDDIVQETFLAAARSARNFRPDRGSLWIWLWTIARRQAALYYRKKKPEIALSRARQWWTDLDGEKFDWIDAKADMPPDILESQELAVLVRSVLSELSGDYQTLLLAKYVDNLPAGQIAGQMDCSETAVRSKLARARKAFRKAFKRITGSAPKTREVSI
ncbi:MAG: RNA polymerase sigma factor [Planctomycetota bacterium]|jgi:RNA polymerase sigma-70 factor (ECF subfamily)